MPAYKLNVTKQGQYQTFKHADKTLVQSEWIRKQETSKIDSVRAALRQELEDLGCATDGPDLRKLRVYQHTFDKIIAEFKQYGPVLAEIKNENRLLLRFERKKSVRMEAIIAQLKKENEFLASELKRKLALYASYLPPTVLSEKRRDDELLAEVEHMIPKHAAGDDPITLYEKKINALEEEVNGTGFGCGFLMLQKCRAVRWRQESNNCRGRKRKILFQRPSTTRLPPIEVN
ncbi:hypothetical protein HDU83_000315 [Entophlyctis luteolus]|nr:hypothetical protein HDU83_000315 [Entophlyctis luteolus]